MTIIRSEGGGGSTFLVGVPHSDSIVFYVDPSDETSYPGSGTVVTDLADNGIDGSLDAGTVVSGGAFVFDETAGKGVSFTKNATLNNLFGGPATVMTFIRQNAVNSGSGRFVSTESGTVGWGLYGFFVFGLDGIRPRLILRSGGGTDGLWSGTEAALPNLGIDGGGDAYGSFAVTLDASTLSNDPTFYTNGQTPNTPSGTNPSALGDDSATDLIIGNDNGGTLNPPTDSQVTIIWDRILTQAEIQQVHNLLVPRMTTTGGVPGTATVESDGAAGAPHLVRTGGLEQSTGIASGNSGCTDLGLYSTSGKGITGSGMDRSAILSGLNNKIDSGDENLICGGESNTIEGTQTGNSVIVAGGSNLINNGNGFIGAGSSNILDAFASSSGVVCGFQNRVTTAVYSLIGAGFRNRIGAQGDSEASFIGAGQDNDIEKGGWCVIGGGRDHDIGAFNTLTEYAFIGGGRDNNIGLTGLNATSNYSGIASGQTNAISNATHSFIGGGQANGISATSAHSAIVGGQTQTITGSLHGFLGGGSGHTLTSADSAFIGGGTSNTIDTDGDESFIGAGQTNTIDSCVQSAIGGGNTNVIRDCDRGFIGAGSSNLIEPQSGTLQPCVIGGGFQNRIRESYGTIGGGQGNNIGRVGGAGGSPHSTIGGGETNLVTRGTHAFIGGGEDNVIGATVATTYCTIPGGRLNEVDDCNYAWAGGRQAKVAHDGAYLWADSTAQDEVSDRDNQFKVVSTGGLTVRTTTGFAGEALNTHTGHDTTTDAVLSANTLFDLTTNQHTLMGKVYVHSQQDTGDNFLFTEFTVFGRRTSATTSVTSTSVATTNTGTGSTVIHAIATSVSEIVLNITGNTGENWQHTFWYSLQEGGFTS